MREIKFRALRQFTGTIGSDYQWIYSSNIRLDQEKQKLILEGVECQYNTLGQYTGLKDKNNKPIYEGDILSTTNDFGTGTGLVQGGTWSYYLEPLTGEDTLVWSSPEGEHWGTSETEVIGSIHENPELVIRTSEIWQLIYPTPFILDPDGWDRTNYQYSWYEEKITYTEYQKRTAYSTCRFHKE